MHIYQMVLTAAGLAFSGAAVAYAQELIDSNVETETTYAMEAPLGEAYPYGIYQYEECVTITFEGGGQGALVGEVPGTGTEFDAAWVTLNGGPASNQPSGIGVGVLFTDSSGVVTFEPARSSVHTFFATSANPIAMEAFDSSPTSLGSTGGAVNAPPFDTWDKLSFDAGDNLIQSVTITGTANGTAIDDFTSCVLSDAPPISCEGFAPPVGDDPITVRKNRALPLRAELIGVDGWPITDADIVSPPVLQVLFATIGSASPPVDVTEDALPAGQSTEGNLFVFQGGKWAYNLSTSNYSAPGTYQVKILSGDQEEYRLGGILGGLPTCEGTFVVQE